MDPTANLRHQLRLANQIIIEANKLAKKVAEDPNDGELSGMAAVMTDPTELAELVLALNNWLETSGFLPATWQNGGVRGEKRGAPVK